MHSGRTPEQFTKRSLVAVSHAIERAALAEAEDGPLVVFALFQRLPYFDREPRSTGASPAAPRRRWWRWSAGRRPTCPSARTA